jgi:hypothetical protein
MLETLVAEYDECSFEDLAGPPFGHAAPAHICCFLCTHNFKTSG